MRKPVHAESNRTKREAETSAVLQEIVLRLSMIQVAFFTFDKGFSRLDAR